MAPDEKMLIWVMFVIFLLCLEHLLIILFDQTLAKRGGVASALYGTVIDLLLS